MEILQSRFFITSRSDFIFQTATNCFTEPSSWYAVQHEPETAGRRVADRSYVCRANPHIYILSTKCSCTTFIRSSEPQQALISLL